MEIKFDSNAARQLIVDMDRYCREIQKEARALLDLTKQTRGWNDDQSRAFKGTVDEIIEDLEKALKSESEYMRTFRQRVRELEENQ